MPVSDQGITRDRYMLIPRVLIFLLRGESVLLLKGAPTKRLWAGKYNGVGGHVERGEDVHSAAHRELLEETGLVANLRLVGIVIVDADEKIGVGIFIFSGECPDGKFQHSSEGALEWHPISRLADLPLVADVAIFLERILQMQAGDPPFSARSHYDENGDLQVEFA